MTVGLTAFSKYVYIYVADMTYSLRDETSVTAGKNAKKMAALSTITFIASPLNAEICGPALR